MLRALSAVCILLAPCLACTDEAPAMSQQALVERLAAADAHALVVLDVRTAGEYDAGRVPGALNIPHDQLADRLAELGADRDREVVVYCRSGRRADIALGVLRAAGFTRVSHLEGDYLGWSAAGRPVEAGPQGGR